MKTLGIDIGTTGISAALLESKGRRILRTLSLPNSSAVKGEKSFESLQDSERIYGTVKELIGAFDGEFDAVGVTGQMHGILYIGGSGEALSPLYTWQDMRSAQPYEGGKTYAGALGVYPGYGAATHFYNKVNSLVPDGARYICTIGDHIAMRLCGAREPLMHITNAASLGCFDIKTNKWSSSDPLLPRITEKFEFVGKTDRGIPVSVCIGDNQASFIGSVSDENSVLINIGTGSQISYLTSGETAPGAELRPFDGKKYLAAGCALCGGRAFADFEKFCREIANTAGAQIDSFYPFLDKILSENYKTALEADCRFSGTRDDPGASGGYTGLTEDNFTLRDFAFATVKGMISELRSMYGGAPNPSIVISGNGARKNPAVAGFVKELFGSLPTDAPHDEEAAAGAAVIALLCATACN